MVKPSFILDIQYLWMVAPLPWVLIGMPTVAGSQARRMCLRMMVRCGQKPSSLSLPMAKLMTIWGILYLFLMAPLSWVLLGMRIIEARRMCSRMMEGCGQKQPS